jgi:exodeoxyribonuclease-5/deoxyribonuclease V
MILAFDTHYFDNKAKTVCLSFAHWTDKEPAAVFPETLEGIAEYVPGEFYKRELPCILSVLKQIDLQDVVAIIVDGFVFLDDELKPGLGAHLYKALDEKIPVIGVAKTNFATIVQHKRPVERGESKNPLYITAIGMDPDLAAQHIKSMHGEFRMPALLKQLDGLTKTR